jgi:hypothetical protein
LKNQTGAVAMRTLPDVLQPIVIRKTTASIASHLPGVLAFMAFLLFPKYS